MHINWVKKNGKELPHCPQCRELLYNFSGSKVQCYRCGAKIEKDEKLKKLGIQKEYNNEID